MKYGDQPWWMRPVEYGAAGGCAGLTFAALVCLMTRTAGAEWYALGGFACLAVAFGLVRLEERRVPPASTDPEAGE